MTKTIPTSKIVPRQKRSVETYNALLDAAERLLREKPWEEISTVDIMQAAGVSNGAIYGRFKSKDDLLVALYERHDERLKASFAEPNAAAPDNRNESIEDFFDREIDALIENYRENRWMLQAMGIVSRQKPEIVTPSMRGERRAILEQIGTKFERFEGEFDHPDPHRAVELVIFFVSTILREAYLYQGPHFGTLDIDERELKKAVKRMAMSFLGARE
jgi:AcrR family transcriptional regulator